MAEPRVTNNSNSGIGGTAVDRALKMNYFAPGGRAEALEKWKSKIDSFSGIIEYDKTDDTGYMTKVANDALKHFGFKPDAQMIINRTTPAYTDYSLIVNTDRNVASYRQFGSEDRKIGANLQDMVESAILYKMGKDGFSLMNAMGGVEGMDKKWKWIGPRR